MNTVARSAIACLGVTVSAVAGAAPPESFPLPVLPSNGVLGSAANGTAQAEVVGGFTLGRIDLAGTIVAQDPNTWLLDARVEIRAPDGTTVEAGPFGDLQGFSVETVSTSVYFPPGTDPTGTWEFRFYELVDDGGEAVTDALWVGMTVTFTDEQVAPPSAIDLGTVRSTPIITPDAQINAGDVVWYRFQFDCDAARASGAYLDLDLFKNTLIGGELLGDAEFALYDDSGNLVAADDDAGPAFWPQLSFGEGGSPTSGDGLPFNGSDGDLPSGSYYLAVGGHPLVAHPERWDATSTASFSGEIRLRVRSNVPIPCNADVNGDTLVDIDDLYAQVQAPTDIDGDGSVDAEDTSRLEDFLRRNEREDMRGGRFPDP